MSDPSNQGKLMSEDPHRFKSRCMTCTWYARWPYQEPGAEGIPEENHGQCRLNPPVNISGPGGSWPHVDDTDWCNKHDPAAAQYQPIVSRETGES